MTVGLYRDRSTSTWSIERHPACGDVLQLLGWLAGDVKEFAKWEPDRRSSNGGRPNPASSFIAVRWYLRYSLSLRDVEELLAERGLSVDHTTVWRWVQYCGPALEQRLHDVLASRRNLRHSRKTLSTNEANEPQLFDADFPSGKPVRGWLFLYFPGDVS